MLGAVQGARFNGPIVVIGFGSIAQGFLPLLNRHVLYDRTRLVVIAPECGPCQILDELGVRFLPTRITKQNYRDILRPLLRCEHPGVIVNLAIDVSSIDIAQFSREIGCHYIDTAIERWPPVNDDSERLTHQTDYALREAMLDLRARYPRGPTALICCGANPGCVSWFVKRALSNLAGDMRLDIPVPDNRRDWASFMRRLGIHGMQIAEVDSQIPITRPSHEVLMNTWSVESFLWETLQKPELGWGTRERGLPPGGYHHPTGCGSSIYLDRRGADTRVLSWTPSFGEHEAFLLTHHESISISDYFSMHEGDNLLYRPTCFFAYRPCPEAIRSLEAIKKGERSISDAKHVLHTDEILCGMDELGVLLYGHAKNAYWFGSQLANDEARRLAPHQNATGLQVSSALLAGFVWMIENPAKGVVETDDIDFARCLEIQTPYLGRVFGAYTEWTPVRRTRCRQINGVSLSEPWQFQNMLVRRKADSPSLPLITRGVTHQ